MKIFKISKFKKIYSPLVKFKSFVSPLLADKNPITIQVFKELEREKLLHEALFKPKTKLTNELYSEHFNRLKDKLKHENKNEEYISSSGIKVLNLHKFDRIEILNCKIDNSVVVTFYDKNCFNLEMSNNLQCWLETVEGIKAITSCNDLQGRLAFIRAEFNTKDQANHFKNSFNFLKINQSMSTSSQNNKYINILIVESLSEWEMDENRTLVLNNIPTHYNKTDITDLCSNFGSVIEVDLPLNQVELDFKDKIKQNIND